MHDAPEIHSFPADRLELPERRPWLGPTPPVSPIPPRLRVVVAALIVVGHVLLIGWIEYSSRISGLVRHDEAITVLLLPPDASTVPEVAPPFPQAPARRQAAGPVQRRPQSPADRPRAAATPEVLATEVPDRETVTAPVSGTRVDLFRSDGGIDLPDQVISDMEAVTSGDRQFGFRDPGLAAADSFARRKPALEYDATRFDEHWQPQQGVVTEALARAVEKTTVTVKIPVFRSPGYSFTCKASILALAGGCGLQRPNDGYVVVLDDPSTLDVEEDKQCQQLWQHIVDATSQREWRALSQRYERDCRKPRIAGIGATAE